MKDKQLIKMFNTDLNKRYNSLVKFLYDNHKKILREWEKTQGKLRIEFLGSENEK